MGINSLSSATVQPARSGLTLVAVKEFGGVPSVSLDGCFTSSYENYQVKIIATCSVPDTFVSAKLRLAGTDSSVSYESQRVAGYNTTVIADQDIAGSDEFYIGYWYTGYILSADFDLNSPAAVSYTTLVGTCASSFSSTGCLVTVISGNHAVATAYDGLTVRPASGTITGKIYVYGYAKAVEQFGPIIPVVTGLEKVASQTFVSSSGASFNNVFTSQYTNYKIVADAVAVGGTPWVSMRLRAAGADIVAANYNFQYMLSAGAAASHSLSTAQTSWTNVHYPTSLQLGFEVEMFGPAVARMTSMLVRSVRGDASVSLWELAGTHTLATSYDGFSIYPATNTMTGTITVYGYRD